MKYLCRKIILFLLAFLLVGCSPTGNPADSTAQPTAAAKSASVTQQPANPTTAATLVQATQKPAEKASPTVATGNKPTAAQSDKIGSALNLVIGTKDRPSVYASYHVVSNLATPSLSDDKTSVVIKKSKTEADVQGSSVHLFRTLADATQSSEGYIIGDKEYKIVDKTPQEMMGQIALGWSFWHLEATFPYSANAAIATKTGTDTFEGRPVNVYTVDTSKIDPAVLEGYKTMGMFPINSSKGTIWIDQQTGALIMANIDYELQVKNLDSDKLVGTGNGHVDISISKIGQVTVKAP